MTPDNVRYTPEPFIRSADQSRQVPLNVLNVVQLRREGVEDVNDDDLPVGLTLVEQSHDAENLNLLHLSNISDLLADFTDIKGIVVTACLGLCVGLSGIFPSL